MDLGRALWRLLECLPSQRRGLYHFPCRQDLLLEAMTLLGLPSLVVDLV
jgi:hypothetical protein